MESSGVKKQSTETRKHYTADYGCVGGKGAEEKSRGKLLGVLFAWVFFHLKSGEKNKRYNVSIMSEGGGEDIHNF